MKKTIPHGKKAKRFFALLILCTALLLPAIINAQATCATSTSLTPNTSCTLTDYSFTGSDTARWFTFTADSQHVVIDIEDPVLPADTPFAHVHTVSLYAGKCSALTLLAERDINSSVPVYLTTSGLKIDYSGLVIGDNYLIRVARRTPAYCAQSLCTNTTTYFSMCVQNLSSVMSPHCIWPGSYNCGEIIGNGGFEYIDPNWNGGTGCPFDITQNHNDMVACQWEAMAIPNSFSTPDFFNSCSNPSDVGVPANGFGYQAPHSGNGYAGLTGWAILTGPPPSIGFEGMMQYFSASPLIAGKVYFEEMYVSLADISNMATTIGFTSFPPVGPNDYYHPAIITDTANWTRVAHCFTAIGGETERVITSNGNTLVPDTTIAGATGYTFSVPNPNDHVAYFFIDDVVLRPLAYAGPSITTCAFNTTIGCTSLSPILGATYSWIGSGPGGITIATPSSQSTNVSVTAAGTYTFIITVTFGSCTDSDTMTFTVTGFTSVVNASPSAICLGGSANLSITNTPSTGPFTYAWGPPSSGLSSYTINNPVATPTATTTYAVIVHNTATGCNSLAFTTVTVSSPSVTIVPPLTDNTCGTSVYTANITGAASPYAYSWGTSANGTISGSSTVNPVTVNWSAAGSGTVTVTVTDSIGCTDSDTITVSTCCISDTGLVITNDTASVALGNPGFIFNRTFNINGTFLIDINVFLVNCTLKMAPNAKIIISGGHKVYIDKSRIQAGCCEMWDAIEIDDITDTLVMAGSYMGDGIRGIVSNDGGVFTLFSTNVLNRNLVSITVNPYAGFHGGTVSGTTFTSADSAYCPTLNGTLLPPYAMQWPLYGMLVTEVDSIIIGDAVASSVGNSFSNLRYGIRTKFTSAGIYNNNFVDIDRAGSASKAVWCGGHYPTFSPWDLRQYNVTVGGDNLSLSEKNTFTDCPFGVFTDTAMTTKVYNNTFMQTYPPTAITLHGTAVRVDNCVGYDRHIEVINDSITNHLFGYYGNQNNGAITQNVCRNTIRRIQAGNSASTGVYIICNGNNSGTTTVLDNNIFANAIGVRLNSVRYATVDSNVVHVRPTPSASVGVIGIAAVNSGGINIRTNFIALENPASPPVTNQWVLGIYVATSTRSTVSCNRIDSLGVGMCFEGSSMSSTVFDNQMESTFTGIWLNNGGIISQQGNATTAQDNTWAGAITRRLYTSGVFPNITNGSSSPFFYRAGAIYLPLPSIAALGNILIPSTLCTGTPDQTICPFVQPQQRMAQQDEDVANGEMEFQGNQDANTWISREGLYRSILEDSTLTIGDPVLANFKDSADQANVGKFTAAMEIHSLGSLNSQNDIADAYTMTTSLTPDGNVEQNYQAVESIMLGHLQNGGGLTAQEIITLQGIAALCPFTDGNAVYLARGLLAPVDTIEYKGPCEGESEESGERIASPYTQENNSASFELYPNPSNGSVIINYHLTETETGKLDVYTITGNLVVSVDLENNQQSKIVTLPQVDAGVYLYKVTVNGELKLVERLVIIK